VFASRWPKVLDFMQEVADGLSKQALKAIVDPTLQPVSAAVVRAGVSERLGNTIGDMAGFAEGLLTGLEERCGGNSESSTRPHTTSHTPRPSHHVPHTTSLTPRPSHHVPHTTSLTPRPTHHVPHTTSLPHLTLSSHYLITLSHLISRLTHIASHTSPHSHRLAISSQVRPQSGRRCLHHDPHWLRWPTRSSLA
jgi:hypothetical protein